MGILNTLKPSPEMDANLFAIGTISVEGDYQVVEQYLNGNVYQKWEKVEVREEIPAGIQGLKLETGEILKPNEEGVISIPKVNRELKLELVGTKLNVVVGDKEVSVELGGLIPEQKIGIKSGEYDESERSIKLVTEGDKVIEIGIGKEIEEAQKNEIVSGEVEGNKLKLVKGDGEKIEVDVTPLLADIKLESARYEEASGSLILRLSDGTEIGIPLKEALKVKGRETIEGDGVSTALGVKISTEANNILKIGGDGGLKVDKTEIEVPPVVGVDTYVTSGVYSEVKKAIELGYNNGNKIEIPIGGLNKVEPIVHDVTLKGDGVSTPLGINIEANTEDSPNLLSVKDNGLYIDFGYRLKGTFNAPLTGNIQVTNTDRVIFVKSGATVNLDRTNYFKTGKQVTIKLVGGGTATVTGKIENANTVNYVLDSSKTIKTFVYDLLLWNIL
jgi:hypothetical protein